MTSVSTTQPSGIAALTTPLPHGGDELVSRFFLRPEISEQIVEVCHGMHTLLCRKGLQVCLWLSKEGMARHGPWSRALGELSRGRSLGSFFFIEETTKIR